MLDKVTQGVAHEGLKKVIQFAANFYLLKKGKVMIKHENMNGLLSFIQVKNNSVVILVDPWVK